MNTPSPIAPLGSLSQSSSGKSNVRIAVISIIALHAVFFGGLLLQGCKPKSLDPQAPGTGAYSSLTNELTPLAGTNALPFGTDTGQTYAAAQPTTTTSAAPVTPYTPPYVPQPDMSLQPVPPAQPVAPAPMREYVVKARDNPSRIAKSQGVSLNALLDANPGLDPRRMKVGQKIQIPAPTAAAPAPGAGAATPGAETQKVHVVARGDTLTKIAQANGVTVKELRTANRLRTDRINVGQKIKIPASKETTPAPSGAGATAAPAGGVPAPAY